MNYIRIIMFICFLTCGIYFVTTALNTSDPKHYTGMMYIAFSLYPLTSINKENRYK